MITCVVCVCHLSETRIVGNIAMLSEGRPGVDNVYSLKDGMAFFRCNSFAVSFNISKCNFFLRSSST